MGGPLSCGRWPTAVPPPATKARSRFPAERTSARSEASPCARALGRGPVVRGVAIAAVAYHSAIGLGGPRVAAPVGASFDAYPFHREIGTTTPGTRPGATERLCRELVAGRCYEALE